MGFDIITPFDTPRGATVKPVLNAKLGAITEGVFTPGVSVGLMEVSPSHASMNFTYVAATETLRVSPDARAYGRLTLGYGVSAGDRAQFNGSFPLHNTRSALMAAYETPLIGLHARLPRGHQRDQRHLRRRGPQHHEHHRTRGGCLFSELGLALRKSIGRAILVAQSAAPSVVRAARSAAF